jgi:hypothetical protein
MANPERALTLDSNFARASLERSESAFLTVPSPFGGSFNMPGGAHVTKVEIEFRHRETGPTAAVNGLTIGGSWSKDADGSGCGLTKDSNFHSDRCTVPIGILTDGRVDSNEVNKIVVNVVASRNDTGPPGQAAQVDIDAIVLRVEYVPGGLAPLCPSGPCNVIDDQGSGAPTIWVGGKVYTPNAGVRLALATGTRPSPLAGIIARHVVLRAAEASGPNDAPIGPPPAGQRQVLFVARVGSDERLRARVRYVDVDGTRSAPGFDLEVLDWTVIR